MEIVEIIIAFAVGFLIGRIMYYRRPLGNLRIDYSDRDSNPYLFLELSTDIATVIRKKYITFRVHMEDFLPHE